VPWLDLEDSVSEEFQANEIPLAALSSRQLATVSIRKTYRWVDCDPCYDFDIEDPEQLEAYRQKLEREHEAKKAWEHFDAKKRECVVRRNRRRSERNQLRFSKISRTRRCKFCHRLLKFCSIKAILKVFCDENCRNAFAFHRKKVKCKNPWCMKRIKGENGQKKLFCSISCRNFTARLSKRKNSCCTVCQKALGPKQKAFCSRKCQLESDRRKAQAKRDKKKLEKITSGSTTASKRADCVMVT